METSSVIQNRYSLLTITVVSSLSFNAQSDVFASQSQQDTKDKKVEECINRTYRTDFTGMIYCLSSNTKRKKNYRELYKRVVQSEWYKQAYENKSIGEMLEVEM